MSSLVGHASVESGSGSCAFVFRRNADVRSTASASTDDLDGVLGIAAGGRHRPEHVEFAGRIDIVVHDDHESAVIGAAQDLRRGNSA